jgi:glucose-6-phosphate-specific signal transduction histidine kinase
MYQDTIDDITRSLSLRVPQSKSLQLLDKILPSNIDDLTLENVRAISQDMTDFHYDFPSLCFALAT